MSEKTEPASDKKLEDARKKGQVPQSKDLASSFALAFALAAMVIQAGPAVDHLRSIVTLGMAPLPEAVADSLLTLQGNARAMVIDALWIVGPILGAAVLGSIVGGIAHVGVNVSFEPLTPKFDKLDPVAGVKRIFSISSLFEVFKSIVKAVLIGWVLYQLIRSVMPTLVRTTYATLDGIGQNAWSSMLRLVAVCAFLAVVLGVIDFVVQKMIFLKQQKMSKDDVKREYKQSEGDPQIKGERKAIAQEMAFSDPAPAVAGANVIVVNPTHYAVALRYKPEEYGLPIIVAKGVDEQAAHIRALATDSGVPIIGNPELARALYKHPLNTAVPEPLLEPVAIVLRWAEQLRQGEGAC